MVFILKASQLFMLLDLVDRYWNGSKSLHQNQKFLSKLTYF
jgi:hypothetical protein